NGVTGPVTIPDTPLLNPSGAYAYGAWIRTADDAGFILKKGDHFVLKGDQAGGLFFGANEHASSTPIYDSAFHYVAVTFTPKTASTTSATRILYIDGTQFASIAASSSPKATTDPLTFGAGKDGADTWQGILDEVGIWSRALSQKEIQDITGAQSAGTCNTFRVTTSQLTLTEGNDADEFVLFVGAPKATFRVLSGDLPLGMSLTSDGRLIGRPTKPGTYIITIEATTVPDAPTSSLFDSVILAVNNFFGIQGAQAVGPGLPLIDIRDLRIQIDPTVSVPDEPFIFPSCAAVPDTLAGWWRAESSGRNELRPGSDAHLIGEATTTSGSVGNAFHVGSGSRIDFGNGP
ncbi:MAG: LamG domain-containing protein, partial [Patescibacteria group bacterium]